MDPLDWYGTLISIPNEWKQTLWAQKCTVVDIDLTARRSCICVNKQPVTIAEATTKSLFQTGEGGGGLVVRIISHDKEMYVWVIV